MARIFLTRLQDDPIFQDDLDKFIINFETFLNSAIVQMSVRLMNSFDPCLFLGTINLDRGRATIEMVHVDGVHVLYLLAGFVRF